MVSGVSEVLVVVLTVTEGSTAADTDVESHPLVSITKSASTPSFPGTGCYGLFTESRMHLVTLADIKVS